MRIDLIELRRGLQHLDVDVDPGELGLPGSLYRNPVQCRLRFHAMDEGWRVELSLSTVVSRVCDRCLVEVDVPVTEQDSCLLLPDASHPGLEEEDRVLLFAPEQEHVELDQVARDALRLAQPDYFLCAPECRGLCPRCGQDLNEAECGCQPATPESPLQALASLRRSTESS